MMTNDGLKRGFLPCLSRIWVLSFSRMAWAMAVPSILVAVMTVGAVEKVLRLMLLLLLLLAMVRGKVVQAW